MTTVSQEAVEVTEADRKAARAAQVDMLIGGAQGDKDVWRKVEQAFARHRQQAEREEEEAHKIGIDEGRQEMVREIDLATGGDGEFRYCMNGDPDRHCPDAEAMKARVLDRFAARHRQSAGRGEAWRPIETAPYDTPVEVKAGSMTFLARLLPDASMSSLDETCDQWQAEIDGEHPLCWSGGACWASNENEDMSLQPTAWQPLPTPPEAGRTPIEGNPHAD